MAARHGWVRTILLAVVLLPRCTCNGCNDGLGGGCGPTTDEGCDSPSTGGGCSGGATCPDTVPAGTHTIAQTGMFGGCSSTCETGWSDCDGNPNNGCETAGACPVSHFDASLPKAEVLATLNGAPRGIVSCDSLVFYFDDVDLESVDSPGDAMFVLTSEGVPTGGLACGDDAVFWATRSDFEAGAPNGTLWAYAIGGAEAYPLLSGLDPGRGIDLGAERLYWIERSAFDAGSTLAFTSLLDDGGALPLMPATESTAYKGFALGTDGEYALANGTLWFAPLDPDAGAPSAEALDASAMSALVAAQGGTYAIAHGAFAFPSDAGEDAGADAADAADDAADDVMGDADDAATDALDEPDGATDEDASDASDDAGDADADAGIPPTDSVVRIGPTQAKLASGLNVVVAAAGGTGIVLASDDTLYWVALPSGSVTVLATGQLHVSDVALDATYAYWTTRGEGTVSGAVWRITLP